MASGICAALPEIACRFPALDDSLLRESRKSVDAAFKTFVRTYGDAIDRATDPLQWLLNSLEKLFVDAPWPLVLLVVAGVVHAVGRDLRITLGAIAALVTIGLLGLWEDTMVTLAMVTVCTAVSVAVGIPLGIALSRSDRLQAAVIPVLDVMQTLPSFVYLIPVVMIFGIGKVPGLIAVVVYAVPPMIRLTNLGIRLVDREVVEAADAFGSSARHRLFDVELPLALPTIMAGVNQTIMMALAMVVVASMIGVGGLGRNVLQAITNQFFTIGFLNGFALVAIAFVFDRASQSYGKRLQRHLEVVHG